MKFLTAFPGKWLYPHLMWKVKMKEKVIFLTFDDGPHPVLTRQVMDILDQYDAKATFFCVGQNVEKYPEVYQEILQRGHRCGNHTFHHLNGWKTDDSVYMKDIALCSKYVESNLFRPAYGRIKRSQIRKLMPEFTIVMWSVLTYDFSPKVTPARCLQIALHHSEPGSIVVFHDNPKASENLLYVLPLYLRHFTDKGFNFQTLCT